MLKLKKDKHKLKTKNTATAILLVSIIASLCFWSLEQVYKEMFVLSLLVAFFEASMVGGVADLFAIHVLFKRPFGLKIPHTAIIPNNKDKIGHALSDFFRENFLSSKYVKENINKLNVAEKIGCFIEKNRNAIVNKIIRATIYFFKTFDYMAVKKLLNEKTESLLMNLEFRNYLLILLKNIKKKDQHHKFVNFSLLKIQYWLENPENNNKVNKWIEDSIKSDGKGGTTFSGTLKSIFMGKQDLSLNVRELIEKLNSPSGDELKKEINNGFSKIIELIEDDPLIEETINDIKTGIIKEQRIKQLIDKLIREVNNWAENDVIKINSKIRSSIVSVVDNLIVNLKINKEWQNQIQEKSLYYLPEIIVKNGEKIDKYIVNYIEKLDANEVSKLIEEKVGDDLQYIRINGSIVGGLVGTIWFLMKSGILLILPIIN